MKRMNRFIQILDKPSSREVARTAYLQPVSDEHSDLPVYELSIAPGAHDPEAECEHFDREQPIQLSWFHGASPAEASGYCGDETGMEEMTYGKAYVSGFDRNCGCDGGPGEEEAYVNQQGFGEETVDHSCGCGCSDSTHQPVDGHSNITAPYNKAQSTDHWPDALTAQEAEPLENTTGDSKTIPPAVTQPKFPESLPDNKPKVSQPNEEEWEIQDTTADDEKFRKDLESILAGGKPPSTDPIPPSPTPAAGGGHGIFDKIAQNMKLATAYDLGAISLEQKFDSFEKDMKGDVEPPPSTHLVNSNPVVTQDRKVGVINASPTTENSQPSTGEFLQDLDKIKAVKNGTAPIVAAPKQGEAPLDPIDRYEATVEENLANEKT